MESREQKAESGKRKGESGTLNPETLEKEILNDATASYARPEPRNLNGGGKKTDRGLTRWHRWQWQNGLIIFFRSKYIYG